MIIKGMQTLSSSELAISGNHIASIELPNTVDLEYTEMLALWHVFIVQYCMYLNSCEKNYSELLQYYNVRY